MKRIRRAVISVSDKSGVAAFAGALAERGTEIISTGGTAKLLKSEGIDVTEIADVTGFPEMLGGRVRTLHPKVFGGILGRRSVESDLAEMSEHSIDPIDLVVVNFYPFEETVAKGGAHDAEIIEKIDIGGPTLLRSAAKSNADVAVLFDPAQYPDFLEKLGGDEGITAEHRRSLARSAFQYVAKYDAAIRDWFDGEAQGGDGSTVGEKLQSLRYGENPHQSAGWFAMPTQSLRFRALQGKELSYNNLLDSDAAWRLVEEFEDVAVAIIKHGNPCGAAIAHSQAAAFDNALACDPVSAFGGIVAANRSVTIELAEKIASMFLEVVIAPSYDEAALARLAKKKRLRLVEVEGNSGDARMEYRSTAAGMLIQDRDGTGINELEWQVAGNCSPDEPQRRDLRFAWQVAKHVRSNAIVLARDGRTIGIGAGQMSRVDSVKLALEKARSAGIDVQGASLASDGFFPFPDGIAVAAEAGIRSVIQPGGSIKDDEVTAEADRREVAMIMTGRRHFRH